MTRNKRGILAHALGAIPFVPRILFVKTSSLGDVVHNCPAVSDVARCVPDASIDWVVEESFAEVVALHASVRRVIPVSIRRWRGALLAPATWSDVSSFCRALREQRYDCVIDSQGLFKSALVAAMAIGPKNGFDRVSVREPLAAGFYDQRHAVSQALHAVERNRRLAAAALGYEVQGECDYGLRASGAAPIDVRAPFAILLTMATRPDRLGKLWPEERWRELVRALERSGVGSVLPWGSEVERLSCERIAAGAERALVPRRMSLTEIACLMLHARCVAGLDTGLAHLAAALGVPVAGIFIGTDPARTGLFGSPRTRNIGGKGVLPSAAEVVDALETLT
jgi:heptosyltransferase-1